MKNNHGFTLIEVLIALAILSIALTAIIRSTSQNIKNTQYLQNKTIAMWVGSRVINEARLGILKLPIDSGGIKKEIETLGQKWEWEATLKSTPNPHIKSVHVEVHQKSNNAKLADLESYLYVS